MKFSIRDILLVTILIALIATTLNQYLRLQATRKNLAWVTQFVAMAQAQLESNSSNLPIVQADLERCQLISETVDQAEKHMTALTAKYSSLEPRDEMTVSVRSVPVFVDRNTGISLRRFQCHVPKDRPIFLKIGIAATNSSRDTKGLPSNWTVHPLYPQSVPSEIQLHSGLCQLDWYDEEIRPSETSGSPVPIQHRFHVVVPNLFHWTTDYVRANGYGSQSLGAITQLDFGVSKPLPILVRLNHSIADALEEEKLTVFVWLDDVSSGFSKLTAEVHE